MKSDVEYFEIAIGPEVLGDLRRRLKETRWPCGIDDTNWSTGANMTYLKELVAYWSETYDWEKQRARLNQLSHFRTEVDGTGIHFILEKGKGPDPFPIILSHGYPDSFLRFAKLIPMLTDPVSFGGRAEDSFDVVVPDLPGYGFSDKPAKHGMIFQVHDMWAHLMTEKLGYQQFGAHGGDWGSTVTEQLARSHPEKVVAIHLTDVPFKHLFQKPHDPSEAEGKFFKSNDEWMKKEGAYALIQSTKPQSLAAGLADSPAGLAAWVIEKYYAWNDCNGNIESRFTKDELLTQIMVYWVTQTIATSFLPYFDSANASAITWIKEGIKEWTGSSKVPAAFALFSKGHQQAPA